MTTYGIIVGSYCLAPNPLLSVTQPSFVSSGTVGSFSSLLGGLLTSYYYTRRPLLPLYLVAFGGLLSCPFVLLMVFSLPLGSNNPITGMRILFPSMSFAYLTAELWLGPIASLLLRLLPPHVKTTSFAIYGLVNLLIYSSGPEIVGIAQTFTGSTVADPEKYVRTTRVILAVIIPAGYTIAAAGFLWCTRNGYFRTDLDWVAGLQEGEGPSRLDGRRKVAFITGGGALGALIIGLLVASFVLGV